MKVHGQTPLVTLKRCQHDACTKYAKASTDGAWTYCKAHMQVRAGTRGRLPTAGRLQLLSLRVPVGGGVGEPAHA